MKALCVAALAALMAWAPTLAEPASAEDELWFVPTTIRIVLFQADDENPRRLCLIDTHYGPDHAYNNVNNCCPISTTDILVRYSITQIHADESSNYGTGSSCIPRDNDLRVADADS